MFPKASKLSSRIVETRLAHRTAVSYTNFGFFVSEDPVRSIGKRQGIRVYVLNAGLSSNLYSEAEFEYLAGAILILPFKQYQPSKATVHFF